MLVVLVFPIPAVPLLLAVLLGLSGVGLPAALALVVAVRLLLRRSLTLRVGLLRGPLILTVGPRRPLLIGRVLGLAAVPLRVVLPLTAVLILVLGLPVVRALAAV